MSNLLYEGTAAYGRFESIKTLLIMIPVLIIGIFLARYFYTNTQTFSKITATVEDNSACTENACNTSVTYKVGDVGYKSSYTSKGNPKSKGDGVSIMYDNTSPTDIQPADGYMSNNTKGTITVAITLTLVIAALLQFYFTRKSKTYAAVSGGASIIQDTLSVFRRR